MVFLFNCMWEVLGSTHVDGKFKCWSSIVKLIGNVRSVLPEEKKIVVWEVAQNLTQVLAKFVHHQCDTLSIAFSYLLTCNKFSSQTHLAVELHRWASSSDTKKNVEVPSLTDNMGNSQLLISYCKIWSITDRCEAFSFMLLLTFLLVLQRKRAIAILFSSYLIAVVRVTMVLQINKRL